MTLSIENFSREHVPCQPGHHPTIQSASQNEYPVKSMTKRRKDKGYAHSSTNVSLKATTI